ncbi:CvpA family protein [Stenotrophomonas sp. YIM B06876]|uniref:CvpA family protein n=1 Tax=Stenotrophomonas sp. YIM B06876 TaxID=3060211 RepID=UPI002739C006|nr:CvpA family protein [Stenotrophomonas sp. YIM B06876]
MIDLVLLAVIGVSALLGLMKGLVGIVVGTLSWLLSGWAAFQFGDATAHWLAEGARPTTTQYLGGYALTFVAVLVVVAVIGMLLRGAVEATRLNGTDRALGFGLGLLRGGFFGCLLVLLMGFTPLPGEAAWQQSKLLPLLLPGASWMRAQLPDLSVPDIELGKLSDMDLGRGAIAGDNAALSEMVAGGGLQQAMSKALGTGPRDGNADSDRQPMAGALPANIDPAQVRPGQPDPARIESPGQARPPSR